MSQDNSPLNINRYMVNTHLSYLASLVQVQHVTRQQILQIKQHAHLAAACVKLEIAALV